MNVKFSTRRDATPNPCKLSVASIADPLKPHGTMLIDCANRKKIYVNLTPEEFLNVKKQFDHCAKRFEAPADGLHLNQDQLNRLGELLNGIFGTGEELIALVQKVTDHNAMLRETLQTKQYRLGELLNGIFGTDEELIALVQKVTDHNAMLRETLQTKQ